MIKHAKPAPGLPVLLLRLSRHISLHRRYQFLGMLGLALAGSLAEVVSLGAVLPFIGILTQPEKVFSHPLMTGVVKTLGIARPEGLVLPLAAAFAATIIITAGLRLLLLWCNIRLANAAGADLSFEVYRRTLYQPYSAHASRNSSVIISVVGQKIAITTNVLISCVTLATSGMLFTVIFCALMAIKPIVAGLLISSFGTGYLIIFRIMRRRLTRNSRCIAAEQTQVIKALQEGLGGIRDVILDAAQEVYSAVYRKAIQRLRQANGENTYINQFPRYPMEAMGMVMISVVVYGMSRSTTGGIQAALPVIGVMVLGAQRLLPLLQQLYSNWTFVVGSQTLLNDVLDLLDQPLPEDADRPAPAPAPSAFHDSICFDNVSFRYAGAGPLVLNGLNLTICKGSRVGFVGSTGSGKSTMMDLLMSLLEPTAGQILVDGRKVTGDLRCAWQRAIAHVPQNIFLADATIAENIALGVPPEEIDMTRVKLAAAQAHIAKFAQSRPEGYSSLVGERGVRLSGGQRQRIGIARALYKRALVLVFDEATSALDNFTEKEMMDTIITLNKELTILIIAHRFTTLRNCDTIVQLEHGKIAAQGSYQHLVNNGFDFQNRKSPAAEIFTV